MRIRTLLVGGVLAAATLGSSAALGAATASASTVPHAGATSAYFTVSFGFRHDNGHGIPSQWLLYGQEAPGRGNLRSTVSITRDGLVSPSHCPASASPCFMFDVSMTASGSGRTVQHAGSPNSSLPGNLNCTPFTVVLGAGSGLREVIYSTGGPVNNLQGTEFLGDTQPFTSVPALAFNTPVNRTVTGYSFTYSPVPNATSLAAPIGWIDSSTNGDGDLPNLIKDGQITCAF